MKSIINNTREIDTRIRIIVTTSNENVSQPHVKKLEFYANHMYKQSNTGNGLQWPESDHDGL